MNREYRSLVAAALVAALSEPPYQPGWRPRKRPSRPKPAEPNNRRAKAKAARRQNCRRKK